MPNSAITPEFLYRRMRDGRWTEVRRPERSVFIDNELLASHADEERTAREMAATIIAAFPEERPKDQYLLWVLMESPVLLICRNGRIYVTQRPRQ
jgi:hypothetical protein